VYMSRQGTQVRIKPLSGSLPTWSHYNAGWDRTV
jgi:hypothetical protein